MPTMNNTALEVVVASDFNYYNYFTEVEEAFVSRRGAPMLISPLDWALIESWKSMGIPLHIVLRGITKSFEYYRPEANRGKRVNTLFYCQQEVLSNFKDFVDSQVGAPVTPATASPNAASTPNNVASAEHKPTNSSSAIFPKQELVDFLQERCRDLENARRNALEKGYRQLPEALLRAISRLKEISVDLESTSFIDAEALERDLTLLEDLLFECLRQEVSSDYLEAVRTEAEQQLRPHKKRMEASIYRQTLENYVAKRLREQHFIPRLSLFYM